MQQQPDFKMATPEGEIAVIKTQDSTSPGIWISVNGEELVLVEFDSSCQQHAIRVWDSEKPDDDYVFKHIVKEKKENE